MEIDEDVEALAQKIQADSATRYFLIKSYSNENIGKSLQSGVWATSFKNEKKIEQAFQTSPYVALVFSVNSSSRFSGYALVTSRPGQSSVNHKVFCGPDGAPFPGRQFDLRWIRHCLVFFKDCDHVLNSFNEMKPAKIGRDGQELCPSAGQQLCEIIDTRAHGGVITVPAGASQAGGPPLSGARWKRRSMSDLERDGDKRLKTDDTREGRDTPASALESGGSTPLERLAAMLRGAQPPTEPAEPATAADWLHAEEQTLDLFPSDHRGREEAERILWKNPVLSIFPVDLREMSFESYLSMTAELKREAGPSEGREQLLLALREQPFARWRRGA